MTNKINKKLTIALLCIILTAACVIATGSAFSYAEDESDDPFENSSFVDILGDDSDSDEETDAEDSAKDSKEKDSRKSFSAVFTALNSGFLKTLEVFGLTLLGAIPLGLLICFGSMSKISIIRLPIRGFIWIIRGTPLMLQLIIIFYGPGLMFGNNFWNSFPNGGRLVAAVVAFVINYACYFSEIYRGGIESISKGQYEAGAVLGMTKTQTFFKVVLAQVIKRIMPSMSNEIITLVKDTSLARIIAVYEIIYEGQSFIKAAGIIWPLFFTGVYYLLFSGLLTIIFGKIEKKLAHIT